MRSERLPKNKFSSERNQRASEDKTHMCMTGHMIECDHIQRILLISRKRLCVAFWNALKSQVAAETVYVALRICLEVLHLPAIR